MAMEYKKVLQFKQYNLLLILQHLAVSYGTNYGGYEIPCI